MAYREGEEESKQLRADIDIDTCVNLNAGKDNEEYQSKRNTGLVSAVDQKAKLKEKKEN